MGYFSSTQTQESKVAPLSAQGEELNSMMMEMIQQNLQEFGGYNVTKVEKTKYADESKAKNLKDQIASTDTELTALNAQLKDAIAGVSVKGQDGRQGQLNFNIVQKQIDALNKKKEKLNNDLGNIKSTTYQDFDLEKKPDPRVQAAMDKFGPDAPEVQAAKETVKQEELDNLQLTSDTNKSFLTNLKKFAAGDMSYTPQQAAQVDTYIGPMKDLIINTTDDLLNQYGHSDQLLRDSLNDISLQIDKTGFEVNDALDAAGVQFEQSGISLMDTLKKVNTDERARAKFQFDLLSQQADQKSAQQAALLGLPPGSQAEHAAAAKMKSDALTTVELELNARESQGALQIQGGVEGGKTQISLAKVDLAQSQGQKKEGLANVGLELTGQLTAKQEGAQANKGNALLGLEQQKQNMLLNAAYGNLPSQLTGTSQGLAFGQNMKNNELATQGQLMNPVAQQLGVQQQIQLAEAKTTTTKNPSMMDNITGLIGAGASAAGAVMGMGGFGSAVSAGKNLFGGLGLGGSSGGGGGGFNLGNFGNQLSAG